jgi:hypothetical protein
VQFPGGGHIQFEAVDLLGALLRGLGIGRCELRLSADEGDDPFVRLVGEGIEDDGQLGTGENPGQILLRRVTAKPEDLPAQDGQDGEKMVSSRTCACRVTTALRAASRRA